MGQIEKVMSHNYANNSDHLSSNIIKCLYIFDLIHFTKKEIEIELVKQTLLKKQVRHDRTFEIIYNCDGANKTYQENESNVTSDALNFVVNTVL